MPRDSSLSFTKILSPKIVVGLMTGTSMDGVDAALVRITPESETLDSVGLPRLKIESIAEHLYPLPENVKKQLNCIIKTGDIALKELCSLNFVLGEVLAEAALEVIHQSDISIDDVDLIGSHGQTIYHLPVEDKAGLYPLKSTLQIGEPSIIAERTGIDTIADFRPRDIAAGGQGAPLVCFADKLLFSSPDETRLIQNIGGIANVTVLAADGTIFAFDTGPGNTLIDLAVKKLFNQDYDKDGLIASKGIINTEILNSIIENEPYFKLPPPKTTGREHFNEAYLHRLLDLYTFEKSEDAVATLTALTAQTIAAAYKSFVLPVCTPESIILGGGGAYNSFLTDRLKEYTNNKIKIYTHDDFGISTKFKEAIAFALLAYASYFGIPDNVSSCTGARRDVVLGKFIPGSRSF
jgi:anhydro-N-acetylmuramic acid kinase